MARPTKTEAIRRLQVALKEIPDLKRERDSSAFVKWKKVTKRTIENFFGAESAHIREFNTECRFLDGLSMPQIIYTLNLEKISASLISMRDEIEQYWEDEGHGKTSSSNPGNGSMETNKIFVIHGRDNETKQTVARFLSQVGLKPIILDEQSNQGQTIIEKFEQHAQVGFAVALLTPDDVGALQEDAQNLKPRARQNVIFELGYFISQLGRDRVCVLTKGNVDIPSNYDGVIYIRLDNAGGWKMRLVKELENAGIAVDANRAF